MKTTGTAPFGIAYKPDLTRPATMGGRAIARPETFDSREQAEEFLQARGEDWLYVVEEQ